MLCLGSPSVAFKGSDRMVGDGWGLNGRISTSRFVCLCRAPFLAACGSNTGPLSGPHGV